MFVGSVESMISFNFPSSKETIRRHRLLNEQVFLFSPRLFVENTVQYKCFTVMCASDKSCPC